MAIALRNESARINSNINVTPMVDVMLVLLIIFMVITPMLRPGVPVDLARTSNPVEMTEAARPDALVVSVARDGKIFFSSEIVTHDVLMQRVKDRLSNGGSRTVFLRADARLRYGSVVSTVDDLRSAGVDQLGLLTEKRELSTTR